MSYLVLALLVLWFDKATRVAHADHDAILAPLWEALLQNNLGGAPPPGAFLDKYSEGHLVVETKGDASLHHVPLTELEDLTFILPHPRPFLPFTLLFFGTHELDLWKGGLFRAI